MLSSEIETGGAGDRQKPPSSSSSQSSENQQARFGTLGGVFTPCVLTILGVIMFMRAGFVTGYAGLWLALAILGISKIITTLTTLSLSAIATNLHMRVGGVYFMISRVLGPDFGGSIGITLFVAQAVSVAFYTIGFTEAVFDLISPLLAKIHISGMDGNQLATMIRAPQIISSLVTIALFLLTFKGADIAIKAQYFVLGILLLSVASFLVGGALKFDTEMLAANKSSSFSNGIDFWTAFAIFFPAATGITAGANMSGDLKNPRRSIPWGTILAILFTACIYTLQIVLTAGSSAREDLKAGAFEAMQQMSVFSPLIVIGVFAATLSSALGSFLGAPRILQAMGQDQLMKVLTFFGKGAGETNEPRRATVLTFAMALGVIWAGDLNEVAEVISMFFLIAYGMINLSAFVESKSGNPSFRPSFKLFHWTIGLAGAIGCAVAMVKINETYALIAIAVAGVIYFYLRKRDIQTSYGDAKRGYIFQSTRNNLFYLEQSKPHPKNWRPILVALTDDAIRNSELLAMGSSLESHRGLYTVAQISEIKTENLASKVRFRDSEREEIKRKLRLEEIVAFCEVIAVDNMFKGLSTFLQSYSIGGLRPNTVLLSMPPKVDEEARERFFKTIEIVAAFDLNLIVLKHGEAIDKKRRRVIDLWWKGDRNGSLMTLLAYLVTLDREWLGSNIRIMRIAKTDEEERSARKQLADLRTLTRISARIEVIRSSDANHDVIAERSGPVADLVFIGMNASSGEEARRSLEQMENLMERLPTTLFIWSNGEADMFA